MLKPAYLALALGAVTASTVLASVAQAQEVEIENAVARVVVIPEDRSDIQVTVDQGAAGLPAIQVSRRGQNVRIDGGLRRRIGSCHGTGAVMDPTRMPPGVRVVVRDHGDVEMAQAPLIVIRTPMDVRVDSSGAVWGAIGRSASASVGVGGCGDWAVANTSGDLSIAIGGSGSVRTGTAGALEAAIGGSGSIATAAIDGSAELTIGGSGDITVASVNGTGQIAVGGSGSVRVDGGRVTSLDVAVAGSGDVRVNAVAETLSATIAGSGDVSVARVTGPVSRSILGSGDLNIGS